jgi:Na+/H+-dicarboxylate symporter
MNDKAVNIGIPNPLYRLHRYLQTFIRTRLWAQVMAGMFGGILVGVLLGPTVGLVEAGTATLIGNWLALPGRLFLSLIQMIVVPLVFASVVRGLAASESLEQLRTIGSRIVLYFVATTVVAIAIGIALALILQPGKYIDSEMVRARLGTGSIGQMSGTVSQPLNLTELPEKMMTILPSNPLGSMVEGQMLQVVIFALIIGAALMMIRPEQARPMLQLLDSLQEVCMAVVKWAMYLAPVAVFGLLAQLTTRIGLQSLVGMGSYVLTVLLGLFLLLCFYLSIVKLFTRISPLSFLKEVREVLLLAFSTSSSAAVMPSSIKTAQQRLAVRPAIAQFVIPLGATINMNGTALYQGVATIFLAQVFGIDLSINAMLLVILVAVGASIGTPATPGVGIVILATVLSTAGVPPSGIALILGVDRILDMSRTAINVAGDLVACLLAERWIGAGDSGPAAVAGETVLASRDPPAV